MYGHCSDGGIIALKDDGYYDCVTNPMKGSDGESMIPLRYTEEWQFGVYSKPSSAILLFTDGIYDFVYQELLEKHWSTPFYVSVLQRLSNTVFLSKEPSIMKRKLEELMGSDVWRTVSDDKTVVTLVNTSKDTKIIEKEYYLEPDWQSIKRNLNKILYGEDYEEIEEEDIENSSRQYSHHLPVEGIENGDFDSLSQDDDIVGQPSPLIYLQLRRNIEKKNLRKNGSSSTEGKKLVGKRKVSRRKMKEGVFSKFLQNVTSLYDDKEKE